MAEGHRGGRWAPLPRQRGQGTHGLQVRQYLGLVLFAPHARVPPCGHNLRRALALGQHSVQGHAPSRTHSGMQPSQGDGERVGLGLPGVLSTRPPHAVRPCREARGSRRPRLLAASQGLALEGASVRALGKARGFPQERRRPSAALGCSGRPLPPAPDRRPGGGTGRALRTAHRVHQGGPGGAPPLGNRRLPPGAAAQGTTGQGEEGAARGALPAGTPQSRPLGQDLDQRTCLGSHRCSSIQTFWLV